MLISKKALKSSKKLHKNQAPAPALKKKLNLKSSKLWLHQKKLEPKSSESGSPKKFGAKKLGSSSKKKLGLTISGYTGLKTSNKYLHIQN